MMLASQMCILRVFGLPGADVAAAVRAAEAEGCPGLRLLERDGEYAVCIQVSAPTQAMADEYCEKWAQKVRARLGDAVYGTGETSLAQVTLDALLKKRRLLVAADAVTGRLIGALLQPLEHSEAAYDFGNQTWADPAKARKIVTPPQLMQRFPRRCAAGRRRARPDRAVHGRGGLCGRLPARHGRPGAQRAFVRQARRAGPGHRPRHARTPPLPTICWTLCAAACWGSGSARRPSPSAPGTSARCSSSRRTASPRRAARGAFSLRRRPARAPEPVREPAPEPAVDGQPTGVIVFENDAGSQKPQSAPQAAPAEPAPGEEEPFAPLPRSARFPDSGPAGGRSLPRGPQRPQHPPRPRRRQPRPPSRRSRKKPRPRPRCWTAISRIFPPGWTRWRWPPPARPTINCRPIRPRTWNRRPAACLSCRTFPPPAKKRPAAPKRTAASPPPRQTTALCRSKTAAWR